MTLREYKRQLEILQNIHPYLHDKKVPETIFTILNKKFDENGLSDYLAYLLHPIRNGIGFAPLQALCEYIGVNWKQEYELKNQVVIEREFVLNNNRRIDLLILLGDDLLIGIEHKVFTGEHGGQTKDYEAQLLLMYPNLEHKYILLAPKKLKPLSTSFQPMEYKELLNILKSVNLNPMLDIRKAVLFYEFITHLEEFFVSNNQFSLSDKTKLYLDHANMINDLRKSMKKDYENLFQFIEQNLQQQFNNFEEGWVFDFKSSRGYQQIYKPHWKKKDLWLHLELAITEESLISREVTFMLDIEGNKRNDFRRNKEENLKQSLQTTFDNNKIVHTLSGRSFAHKKYALLTPDILEDQAKLADELQRIFEDFKPFINAVDCSLK